ncbi:MAG: 4Fe-4S binding protein [Fibrobacterota bacterium]
MKLTPGLTDKENLYKTIYVDTSGLNYDNPEVLEKIEHSLLEAYQKLHEQDIKGPCLSKVHIGEPKCRTAMLPRFIRPGIKFAEKKGANQNFCGDTTVAYTGKRGYSENPHNDPSAYMELAKSRGWMQSGDTGVPFAVLDRPVTSSGKGFEFKKEEGLVKGQAGNYKDFFAAGGFLKAGFIQNHAHLTLHGLAGVAASVKSIAMGCTSLRGKLRMHQHYMPVFNPEKCTRCGKCIKECPVEALSLPDRGVPSLRKKICIGCGECEAVCPSRAVTLNAGEITDWGKGMDTLSRRMADYAIGLIDGRWDSIINTVHIYTVTERCDCLNTVQKPMITDNPGFVISKNPFYADSLAAEFLKKRLPSEAASANSYLTGTAKSAEEYVKEGYGILSPENYEVIKI